jgi:hypothetical protein
MAPKASSFGLLKFDLFVLTEQILKVFDMSDFSWIQALQHSGTKDEWPIRSEKLLAKAKCSGFKDLLLGNVNIPKSDQ